MVEESNRGEEASEEYIPYQPNVLIADNAAQISNGFIECKYLL
jgi:hypothetical protein